MSVPLGYVRIPRGLFDNPELASNAPLSRHECWLWMLENAAYVDHRKRVGVAIVDLRRGQLAGSSRFLAVAWRWEESRVRRFLTRLKAAAMITAETAAGITIITICNYEIFPGDAIPEGAPIAASITAETPQHRRKLNKGNTGNIDSPSSKDHQVLFSAHQSFATADDFESWWRLTPRKVGKGQARRAFITALRQAGSHEILCAGIARYAAAVVGVEPRYIAHPVTWLRGERWLDGIEVPPVETKSTDEEWLAAKAAGGPAMDALIAKRRGSA